MTGFNLCAKASAKTSSAVASRARSSDSAARGPSFAVKTTKSTLSKQNFRAIKVYHDFDKNVSKHTSDNFTNRQVAALRKSLDSARDAFLLSPSAATARTFRESARSIVDYQKKIEMNTARAELESNTRKLTAALKKIEQRFIAKLQNVYSMVRSKISGCCDSSSTAGIIADVFPTASQEAAYIAGSIPSVNAPAHVGTALTSTIECAPKDVQQTESVDIGTVAGVDAELLLKNHARPQLDQQAGPVEFVEVVTDSKVQSSADNLAGALAGLVSILSGADEIENYAASLNGKQDKQASLLEFVESFRVAAISCGKLIDIVATPQTNVESAVAKSALSSDLEIVEQLQDECQFELDCKSYSESCSPEIIAESTFYDISIEVQQHFIPPTDNNSFPAGKNNRIFSGNSSKLCLYQDAVSDQKKNTMADNTHCTGSHPDSCASSPCPCPCPCPSPSSSSPSPSTPSIVTPVPFETSFDTSDSSSSWGDSSWGTDTLNECFLDQHEVKEEPCMEEALEPNVRQRIILEKSDDHHIHSTYWPDYVSIHPLSGRPVCLFCNPGANFDTRSLDIEDVFDKYDYRSEMLSKVDAKSKQHQHLLASIVERTKNESIEAALDTYLLAENKRMEEYSKYMMVHLYECPHLQLPARLAYAVSTSMQNTVFDNRFVRKYFYNSDFRSHWICEETLNTVKKKLSFLIGKFKYVKYRITRNPTLVRGADYLVFSSKRNRGLKAWKKSTSHDVHRFLKMWPDNEGRTVIWYKEGSEEERAKLAESDKTMICSTKFSDKVEFLGGALLGKPTSLSPLDCDLKPSVTEKNSGVDSAMKSDLADLMSGMKISTEGRVLWV